MGFSFSSRAIKNRPSVKAMQRGGYERAGSVPDANNPAENYGAYASENPTHVGSQSAIAHNSAMAERGRANTKAYREDANRQGGLTAVVQGLDPTGGSGRNWDAFAGALDMFGVDQLQSGAAAGYEMGDFKQTSPGMFTRGVKPGFLDTPSMGALQQGNANYLNTQDRNREAGQAQNQGREEMTWELNARELDKKDAQRGVTNIWSGRKKGLF